MNGNYLYSGEGAYRSEGLSLKQTLIKSSNVIIKQRQRRCAAAECLSKSTLLDTAEDKFDFLAAKMEALSII